MAEFKEFVNNARSLCRSRNYCNGCPLELEDEVCFFDSVGDPYIKIDLERIESIVMQWAKDHPEDNKEEEDG